MEDEPFVFTPTGKGPWVVEYVERLFRRREDETEASPEARKYTLWERLVWDSPLGSVIMLSLMFAVKLLGSRMGLQQAPKSVGGWRNGWRATGFETAVEQALMRGLATA